ncbi:MAG: hypothetical protein KY468_05010 [Armatimonadetes bacterium]|nr:hypothetical protein [Armatimonadota bacterium]
MILNRLILLSVLLAGMSALRPAAAGTRASDELFWVPTIEQALEMASATGRPIFMVAYTCVSGESETYNGGKKSAFF